MVLLLWDGKKGGVDRPSDHQEQITTKIETIKEKTDIQDGRNLPKGKPKVSSILHLNTDQSGGLPGPVSQY